MFDLSICLTKTNTQQYPISQKSTFDMIKRPLQLAIQFILVIHNMIRFFFQPSELSLLNSKFILNSISQIKLQLDLFIQIKENLKKNMQRTNKLLLNAQLWVFYLNCINWIFVQQQPRVFFCWEWVSERERKATP